MPVSELMKAVKAKSSKYVNDHHLTPHRFEWQEGYGAFSYGERELDMMYRYVQNQEEHHKVKSFHEEYIQLLTEYKIKYDIQYIFHDPV